MTNLPVLKAEVLLSGMGCPVCGGEKTTRARTCRSCFESLGFKATQSVDDFTDTCIVAAEGNATAAQGGVERNIVFGPVFAQFKVDKNARYRNPGNGIAPYWECMKAVQGGFVSMFVFGEAEPGQTVSGLVELKTKQTKKGNVHYLRAQTVADVRSNVKLRLEKYEVESLVDDLPFVKVYEGGRAYAVSFVSA